VNNRGAIDVKNVLINQKKYKKKLILKNMLKILFLINIIFANKTQTEKPNVIVIMLDDLGWSGG